MLRRYGLGNAGVPPALNSFLVLQPCRQVAGATSATTGAVCVTKRFLFFDSGAIVVCLHGAGGNRMPHATRRNDCRRFKEFHLPHFVFEPLPAPASVAP